MNHEIPPILDFSNQLFRCHALSQIMSSPKGGSNMDKYKNKRKEIKDLIIKYEEKISVAKKKRDEIKNVETKGWTSANDKVLNLESEYKSKLEQLESEASELEKTKDEVILSDSCITYLLKIYEFQKTGRRKDLKNRYVEKGLKTEEESINLVSEIDDEFYVKNSERRNNGFIEGECDIYNEGIFLYDDFLNRTIDIKASWDADSHRKQTVNPLDDDYDWQGQGYMILWKCDIHHVWFTLINTPEELIQGEMRSLLYSIGTDKKDTKEYNQLCEEIRFLNTYDDKHPKERVVRKFVYRNKEAEEQINQRVKECRIWLNEYAKSEHERNFGEIKKIPKPVLPPSFKKIEKNDFVDGHNTVVDLKNEELKNSATVVLTEIVNDSDLKVDNTQPLIIPIEEDEVDIEEDETNVVVDKETGEITESIDIAISDEQKNEIEKDKKVWKEAAEKSYGIVVGTMIEEPEDIEDYIEEQAANNSTVEEKSIENDNSIHLADKKVVEVTEDEMNETDISLKIKEIQTFESIDECIDFYKANEEFLIQNPIVKESLTEQKEKIYEKLNPPTVQPPPPTKKTTIQPPSPEESAQNIDVKSKLLLSQCDECKTEQEVKDLYFKNEHFIIKYQEINDHFKRKAKDLKNGVSNTTNLSRNVAAPAQSSQAQTQTISENDL